MKKALCFLAMILALSHLAQAQDFVTIYADCYYRGAATKLYPGRQSLQGTSVGPSAVSSMVIPNGFKVVVYDSDDPGTGNKMQYYSNVSCMSRDWNDRIRSVVIERVGQGGGNNNNNNNNNYDDYPITIYADCDYRGRAQGLSAGYHNVDQLGIGGRNLSSLRLAEGYGVILYDQPGYRGRQDTWNNTVACLGDFNNRTQSIYVYRKQGGNQGNQGNQGGNRPSGGNSGSYGYPATIYADCDYRGRSQNLSAGYHDVNQLGIGGRNLSSIRLAEGYGIILYDQQRYQGAKDTWNNSVACLGDFNNRTMSVYIYRQSATQLPSSPSQGNPSYGDGVTFYTDCDYRGRSTTLHEGAFSQRQMGITDNSISSIRVPPGYSILVFINDNFGGSMKNFTSDVNCLDYNWNDKISSVQISRH